MKLFNKVAAIAVGVMLATGVGAGIVLGNRELREANAVDYQALYEANFLEVDTHSYTMNKTFTLSTKSWTSSVSQVNSGVFYLGCNSTNASKGVLGGTDSGNPNNGGLWTAVDSILASTDAKYTSGTTHAYAMLFENSYSNVTKVSFGWSGGNNAFQVYLFGDTGSGYALLNSTNYATSGASVSGSVEWTGSATTYSKIAIVARPGTASTTATNKTLRASTFGIYQTASAQTTYTVTYADGGATGGSVPVDSNSPYHKDDVVTVLGNTGSLVKTDYTFQGWRYGDNTYTQGQTFTMPASNVTLTAVWYHNDTISAKESSYEIYTDATLNLSNCVTSSGDGTLSFDVPTVNYLTYDSSTTTITADSSRTGGPLTITAHKGSANCTFTVSVVTRPSTGTFTLFSGSLVPGDYVVYYNGYTLKAEISSNRFANISATPVNDKIDNPDALSIWKIAQSDSYWTLYNESVGKYAGGNTTKNQGALLSEITDYAKWSVDSSSESTTYDFVNYGRANGDSNTGNKYLRQNGTNGWACYADATGGAVSLYKLEDNRTITASRMTTGTVSASSGDSDWTLEGFSFEVQYDNEATWYEVNATYIVSENVPTINNNGTLDVTVTGTFGTASQTSNTIHATLTFINLYSISRLYDIEIALGSSYSELVTFDGIYMGESGGGFIVMNGAYGMMVYGSHDVSGYTEGETYLTVTGTLKNYNYLYEINNDSSLDFDVLTDATRKSHVGTPSTYVVTGSESSSTLYLANRKTSLSGTVYSIGGNTTAGTKATSGSNNTVLVTVGGNNVILYIKSAQATTDVADKIEVGEPITVEGFTTYFKSNNVATFEVMFTGIVDVDANYHTADFAKDLLKMTKGLCNSSYDGVTNNGSALTSIWTTLAGADYWLKVEANGEESSLINGTPDSTIVVPATDELIEAMSDADAIAAALYRYDYCTAKYSLTNFMSRTLTVSFSNRMAIMPTEASTAAAMVVVVVSAISVTAIGGFFLLKKKPF